MNFFTYNGRSSSEFGLHIESKNVFSAPEYAVEMHSIPGRNGDLIVSGNRFSNIKISYTVFLARKNVAALSDTLRQIKEWLYTEPDRYHDIIDSYDGKHIRLGVICGSLDVEEQLNRVGCFTVSFSCKPYRYSLDGQSSISFTTFPAVLSNPTVFPSSPYIKITGSGTITMTLSSRTANRTWSFQSVSGYIEMDSEAMNFYKDKVLKNGSVTGDGFPMLYSGKTTITVTGTVTRIDIIPRWCSL